MDHRRNSVGFEILISFFQKILEYLLKRYQKKALGYKNKLVTSLISSLNYNKQCTDNMRVVFLVACVEQCILR